MLLQKTSFHLRLFSITALLLNLIGASIPQPVQAKAATVVTTPNPILFVTQVPIREDFTTIGSVFGNHTGEMQSVGRGGDLWMRYPNGTLKNLTQTAGYGSTGAAGFQNHTAIAVRDPSVYWDGTKALFSMVIGAPEAQDTEGTYYWQIYEVTGLNLVTQSITKVANQPTNFNNVSPIYGTDDRIIFTSDRPRNGAAHLYPQRDEYESSPTVTGLWSLNPTTGDLFLMNHAPSGDFTPIIDSFGRVVFTQWDHLERDSKADIDKYSGGTFGTFNWSNESASAVVLNSRAEIYPEPRATQEAAPNTNVHSLNQFFPWQINEDGTMSETLNHVGRHELSHNFFPSFTNDPNLKVFYSETSGRNYLYNFLQIKEDPKNPGKYFGVDAPRLRTHAAGQIISIMAPPTLDADHISINYVTHRDTSDYTSTPTANHSGLYRDPLPLSDGTLIAAHTAQTDKEAETGTTSIYDFRLKTVTLSGNGFYTASQVLTSGISKTVSYWDRQYWMTFSGNLWELQPVEVRARTRPTRLTPTLGAPEQQIFNQQGVNVAQFQTYLRQNNLALIVGHNVTTRDDADLQQPFNLRVPNGVQTLGTSGTIYDVKYLQLFQADQLRSFFAGLPAPKPGRRVLAQLMHDAGPLSLNPPVGAGPSASVLLGTDGSMAAFVPARRAMTWQLTNPAGGSVVRERYWLTMQPGEIRVCGSCHGVNVKDQAGSVPPVNPPLALAGLLQRWKSLVLKPSVTFTTSSVSTADGWILESGENSNVGGSLNAAATIFYLGDNAVNRQYRSILHFNTSALPDTAVITSVTLKIKKQGLVGTNPFTTHGKLLVDIRANFFGAAVALALNDFQAAAGSAGAGSFGTTPTDNWYSAVLNSAAYPSVSRTGTTQFRLRFTLDDNNDKGADSLAFYSGNAPAASRPQLIIKYYIP